VLAKQTDVDEGNVFTGGLLHDLGRVILAVHFPEHFAAVRKYQEDHYYLSQEAEMAVLGIDHCVIGKALAEKWNFPNHICRVIATHHQPEQDYINNLPRLIHVADIVSRGLDRNIKITDPISPVNENVVSKLGLDWMRLGEQLHEMEESYLSLSSLLDATN
jgi:putative nucleotidyltransferase with HDIG domain